MSSKASPTLIAALLSIAFPAAQALAPFDAVWSSVGDAFMPEQADSVL